MWRRRPARSGSGTALPRDREVESLPAGHPRDADRRRRPRDRARAPSRARVAGGPRREKLEAESLQRVAREQRRRFAEDDVARGPSPAQRIVVHARQVVVDERIRMEKLERRGRLEGVLREALLSAGVGSREEKERPQPLAAREDAVAHRRDEGGRLGSLPGQDGEERVLDVPASILEGRRHARAGLCSRHRSGSSPSSRVLVELVVEGLRHERVRRLPQDDLHALFDLVDARRGRSARAQRPPRTARGSPRGPSRDPRARRRSPGGARAPFRTAGSSAGLSVFPLLMIDLRGDDRGPEARPRARRTRKASPAARRRGVRHGRRSPFLRHDCVAARENAQRAQGLEAPGGDAELLVRGRDACGHPVRGGAPLAGDAGEEERKRGAVDPARDALFERRDARREGRGDSSKGGEEGGAPQRATRARPSADGRGKSARRPAPTRAAARSVRGPVHSSLSKKSSNPSPRASSRSSKRSSRSTTSSAACEGVAARTSAARSVSVTSTSWPTARDRPARARPPRRGRPPRR